MRLHKAEAPEPGYPTADIAFRKTAEPVAWRVEPRVFVFLAFDGTRLAPAWPLGEKVKVEGRMQKDYHSHPQATLGKMQKEEGRMQKAFDREACLVLSA